MIKNLFGILVIVSLNVIKRVMLVNCKRRKKLVAPLVHECAEPVEAVKLAKINLAENEKSYCSSCTMYIVLFWIHFTINVGGIGIFTGT